MRNNEIKKEYVKREFYQYSNEELKDFDKEMGEYKKEIKITYPKEDTLIIYNEKQYLIDKGVLNKSGSIVVQNDYTEKYTEFEDKLNQWKKYKGRCKFIENKKIEGLEELSKGMKL